LVKPHQASVGVAAVEVFDQVAAVALAVTTHTNRFGHTGVHPKKCTRAET
jgi:hypothetical protein